MNCVCVPPISPPPPVIESKLLQGESREHSFSTPGTFIIENTTVEFQKGPDRETIKIAGPLGADFIVKVSRVQSEFCLPTHFKSFF